MSRRHRRKGKKVRSTPHNALKHVRATKQRNIRANSASQPNAPDNCGPSTVVSLDPLAPIIVRSGRPFDDQAGADPARFPPPSTLAGCLRTAWARTTGQDFGAHLLELAVAGPLLLNRNNKVLVPKPADALYFSDDDSVRCIRAEPQAFDSDCGADLPDGLPLPVMLTEDAVGKPGVGPAWWLLKDLLAFRLGRPVVYAQLQKNGWSLPEGDRRTHVAINRATGAADEGQLFQIEGLVFDAHNVANGAAQGGQRLLARCGERLQESLVHLGGERRLAALAPEDENLWPTPPAGWLREIADSGGLCLTLLTPGVFSAGYRPGWLDADLVGRPPWIPGLRLQLCAAAVEHWQPHSGWNLAQKQPRPSRKLARAGTTYWFRILELADADALEPLWLSSLCDLEQDRRDGFGLALPSRWTPPLEGRIA